MAGAPPLPTIDFYTRRDCPVCEEARFALQQVLEDRAMSGKAIARVRYVAIDGQAELEATYGPFVPVLAIGGGQLQLISSYRAINHFLDVVLGRLA